MLRLDPDRAPRPGVAATITAVAAVAVAAGAGTAAAVGGRNQGMDVGAVAAAITTLSLAAITAWNLFSKSRWETKLHGLKAYEEAYAGSLQKQVADLKQTVADRDATIQHLSAHLARAEAAIERSRVSYESEVNARDRFADDLQAHIKHLTGQLGDLARSDLGPPPPTMPPAPPFLPPAPPEGHP